MPSVAWIKAVLRKCRVTGEAQADRACLPHSLHREAVVPVRAVVAVPVVAVVPAVVAVPVVVAVVAVAVAEEDREVRI